MECFKVKSNNFENRLDPNFYRPEYVEIEARLASKKCLNLADIVSFSKETWNQKDFFEDKFPYIEISAIDIFTGKINDIEYYSICSAPSRAKMIIRENDIILSTTRPHRGAISTVSKEQDGFIASTGFAILRNQKNKSVDWTYLFHILRTELVLKQLQRRSSGGNYPAITLDELTKIRIPVPEVAVQREVINLFDKSLQKHNVGVLKAKELLSSIDEYVLSELGIKLPELKDKTCFVVRASQVQNSRIDPIFYSLDFYSVLEKNKFKSKTLKEITKYLKTGFPAGSEAQAKENGIIQLRPTNIDENRELIFDKNIFVDETFKTSKKDELLSKGEVLFNNTNSQELVGKTVFFVLDGNYFCSNHITRIKVDEKIIIPYYLKVVLNCYQKIKLFYNICTNWNNQSGVNIELLKTIPIPVPPLAIQQKIADEVKRRMDKAKQLQKEAQETLEQAKKKAEEMILGEK